MSNVSITAFQDSAKHTLDHLHGEFSKLQTGRANAAMVEHITVEAYGQRMEIKSLATISIQDARSMLIQPWDKSVLTPIEKAIQMANIGINPVNDGVVIRLNFPPMTAERREQMTKIVGQLAEQAKIQLRQHRQKANDEIKAIADENERERLTKELQKHVDEWNAKIEDSAKKKQQEVTTV